MKARISKGPLTAVLVVGLFLSGFPIVAEAPPDMAQTLAAASEPAFAEAYIDDVLQVTLITGDVVTVAEGPDGRRSYVVAPAEPESTGQRFLTIQLRDNTYIIPGGVDLQKLDIELFNIDYLVDEEYYSEPWLPLLVSYSPDLAEPEVQSLAGELSARSQETRLLKGVHAIATRLAYHDMSTSYANLMRQTEVEKVWLDKKVYAQIYQSVPWVGAELWWDATGNTGEGVHIAILDTGIDSSHPALEYLPGTDDPKVIVNVNFSDDPTYDDLHGHGTHVAGIAAGSQEPSSEVNATATPSTYLLTGTESSSIAGFSDYGRESNRTQEAADFSSCSPCSSMPSESSIDSDWSTNPVIVNIQVNLESEEDESYIYGILSEIESRGWTTSVFVTGEFASEHPQVLAQIEKRGHYIGVYGWESGEDLSLLSYSEQLELIKKALSAVRSAVAKSKYVVDFKPQNLKYNNNTIKALQDLNMKSITATFSADESFVQCPYAKSVGKVTFPYPITTDFVAVPISYVTVDSEEVLLDDNEVFSKIAPADYFHYLEAKFDAHNETKDPMVIVTSPSVTGEDEAKFQVFSEFLDYIEEKGGKVKPTAPITVLTSYIPSLDIVSAPDSAQPGESITVTTEFSAAIYCPSYYFRIYGKYPGEKEWRLYAEHYHGIQTGTFSFSRSFTIPEPPAGDSLYTVRVVGQGCAGTCWPEPHDGWHERMDEVELAVVSRILPAQAAELTRQVIGAPYLGDGRTWGGKGEDCSQWPSTGFGSADEITEDGYRFYDGRIEACNPETGTGLDCSGLIYWSYNRAFFGDEPLDRRGEEYGNRPLRYEGAHGQYSSNTVPIDKGQLRPGDLLFFDTNASGLMNHVAMYVGGEIDNVIHASGFTGTITYATYDPENEELITVRSTDERETLNVTHYGRVTGWEVNFQIRIYSPVSVSVEDPEGLVTSPEHPWKGPLEYQTEAVDGALIDVLITGDRRIGDYVITLDPKPGALPTDAYSLEVIADGIATPLAQSVLIDEIPEEPYVYESQPPTTIQGTVSDNIGDPVPDAYVLAIGPSTASTITDFHGSYDMTRLPSGSYTIRVEPVNPNLMTASAYVSLTAGQTAVRNFALQAAGSIAGNITDGDGRGIPDMIVYLSGYETPRYRTDEDGSYAIPRLQAETHTVNVDATGTKYASAQRAVEVTLGNTTTADFVLQEPHYRGVAPGAWLWNVKVLNQSGWGYESWIINGINSASLGLDGKPGTGDEADIINISLGGWNGDGTDPLSEAVNLAVERGVVVVVAAGNSGSGPFTIRRPGVAERAITVGAVDKLDNLAYFSSCGPTIDFRVKPDVVAPGVDIMSCVPGGGYEPWSGSSMAASHVAGAAALLREHYGTEATPQFVKDALTYTALDLGYSIYEQGGGRLDLEWEPWPAIGVTPANLSMGLITSHTTTGGELTFFTTEPTPQEVTLSANLTDTRTGIDYSRAVTLEPASFTIPAGGEVQVSLEVDLTGLPHCLFEGKVTATADDDGESRPIHAIFGFAHLSEVTVYKIDINGEPARWHPLLVLTESPYEGVMHHWAEFDEFGNLTFYATEGTYHFISPNWGHEENDVTIWTIEEDVIIAGDTPVNLDERETLLIDFDPNSEAEQVPSAQGSFLHYCYEYSDDCCMYGDAWGVTWWYPTSFATKMSPISRFDANFTYNCYPSEDFRPYDPELVNTSEWYNLRYSLTEITSDITLVADHENLVHRDTVYCVALEGERARWSQRSYDIGWWPSMGFEYAVEAPQQRWEWLSPQPVRYYQDYRKYREEPGNCWCFSSPRLSYPPGECDWGVGAHPFTSDVDIWTGWDWLEISGRLFKDSHGNRFYNGCVGSPSGHMRVTQNGEVVIEDDIWDWLYGRAHFEEASHFTVEIWGETPLALSTDSYTRLDFTADPAQHYHLPRVTGLRVPGMDTFGVVFGGDVEVMVRIVDEGVIDSANLYYSVDDGDTWSEAGTPVAEEGWYVFSLGELEETFVDIAVDAEDEHGNTIHYRVGRAFRVGSVPPLGIVTTELPVGWVGVAYEATLKAIGGSKPYTWATIDGNLPPGLNLSGSTGVISGTPTEDGTFNFTVRISDAEHFTADRDLSIVVKVVDTVRVTVEAPASVAPASSLVARVNIDDVTNLFAAEYTVSFDDTVLELVNVTAGIVGGKAFHVSVYNPAIHKVVQNAPGIAAAVSGSGYLAELHFNVIGSIGDTSDIDPTGGMLANTEAQEIAATWTGASVEVVDLDPPAVTTNAASAVTHDSATLNGDLESLGDYTEVRVRFQWGTTAAYGNNTPWQAMTSAGPLSHLLTDLEPETQYHFRVQVETVLPANTVSVNGTDMTFTTEVVPCIPGDANGDGVINVLDLAWTARIIAGLEENGDTYPGADANQDGVINVLDLAKIARIIAGLG